MAKKHPPGDEAEASVERTGGRCDHVTRGPTVCQPMGACVHASVFRMRPQHRLRCRPCEAGHIFEGLIPFKFDTP